MAAAVYVPLAILRDGAVVATLSLAGAAVTDFARRWYVASNMTLVVVAPGTPEQLESLVQNTFGALPRVPRPASPEVEMDAWVPPSNPVVIEDAGEAFGLKSAVKTTSPCPFRPVPEKTPCSAWPSPRVFQRRTPTRSNN